MEVKYDETFELNSAQILKIREAFDYFDHDLKEELPAQDVALVLQALGIQVTPQQNEDFLMRGVGRDRRVNFDEVLSFFKEIWSQSSASHDGTFIFIVIFAKQSHQLHLRT